MNISDQQALKDLGINFDVAALYASDYSALIKILREKVRAILSDIEAGSKEFNALDEDGLSQVLITTLKHSMLFYGIAQGNSRGHVDLTIVCPTIKNDRQFKYLGEAKIWNGAKKGIAGFVQLGGYMTGGHPTAFMMLYFKTKTCDDMFSEYIKELISSQGGSVVLQETRFATTKHSHSSAAVVDIDHYAAHLPPTA